jgi:type I pantothenate kinase
MDKLAAQSVSPYRVFTRGEWAGLRAGEPMTLTQKELRQLQGINERVSAREVEQIHLPLSRLLDFYVVAAKDLHAATERFLGGKNHAKMPFIIGLAGSVAVGKSTTARILQALLGRWPGNPKVDLVPTDGFLLPNAVLEKEGLMDKKGFPESFDLPALLRFMTDVKAGQPKVRAPVYSHFAYDVMPGRTIQVDRPEILIVEGLNVLQPARLPKDGTEIPFVSDFFDFSIYIDADADVIERWYVERFMELRKTAFRDPASYFHRYSQVSDEAATEISHDIWRQINLRNLRENILPTRQRADLILHKGKDHQVEKVALRKL